MTERAKLAREIRDELLRRNVPNSNALVMNAERLCALLESEVGQEGEAVEGWEPIESAPKDGTTIMLWSDATRHALGYWVNAGGMWWPKEGGAWIVANGVGKAIPTHWRPLPPPPAQPSPSSESKP